jgi:hypothetical protein
VFSPAKVGSRSWRSSTFIRDASSAGAMHQNLEGDEFRAVRVEVNVVADSRQVEPGLDEDRPVPTLERPADPTPVTIVTPHPRALEPSHALTSSARPADEEDELVEDDGAS